MAKTSITHCPHCGQSFKLLPLQGGKLPQTFPKNNFESVAGVNDFDDGYHVIEESSFWQSDGVRYAIAGGVSGLVLLAAGWWYETDVGIWAAVLMLASMLGLHFLKIWLHRTYFPEKQPAQTEKIIKVEYQSEDRTHWLLGEIDKSITMDDLERVAKAIEKGANYSRNALPISQGKYKKLTDSLFKFGYVSQLPNGANGYELSPRGRALMRQIAQG